MEMGEVRSSSGAGGLRNKGCERAGSAIEKEGMQER
jgi:hypothetical protein